MMSFTNHPTPPGPYHVPPNPGLIPSNQMNPPPHEVYNRNFEGCICNVCLPIANLMLQKNHPHGYPTFPNPDLKANPPVRRKRTIFTSYQLLYLDYQFKRENRPSVRMRTEMALTINLETRVVTNWFRNKRAAVFKLEKRKVEAAPSYPTS